MMDKKLLYRKIRQLQLFKYAYSLSDQLSSGSIYEITKLWYDKNKNLQKTIDYVFVKSNAQIPVYDGFDIFDIHITLLNSKDVNRLINEANSYGIDIDRFSIF